MGRPRGSALTEYQRERIKKLRADGMSYAEISRATGISPTRVREFAIKMNIGYAPSGRECK